MAEPVRTDDFPAFDTYPGPESPRSARAGLDLVAGGTQQHSAPDESGRDSRLHEAAEQIGSTLGRAVKAVQQLPETMDQARTDLKDRMTVIRSGATKEQVSGKAAEIKEAAQEKLGAARDRAVQFARDARLRAQRVADERPLVVLLGVFIGAFALGAALRIWRSHE